MSEPRTRAGRDLIRRTYGGRMRPREDFEALRDAILAIEAQAGALDGAWTEAEAALPEEWVLTVNRTFPTTTWPGGGYNVDASRILTGDLEPTFLADEQAETLPAALRALAAKLRERSA